MMMWQRPGAVKNDWVSLNDISAALQSAVVAAEDANFYEHHGVDFDEMKKSIEKNQKKKRYARGFSTITMQLAKNIYLTSHKHVARKVLEIGIAFEMEWLLSKERILELYLNLVEWSEGVYGAEAAANHYFRRNAGQLGPEQASFLAAILPNPRKWGRWPPGPYVRKRMGILQERTGSLGKARGEDKKRAKAPLPDMPDDDSDETPEPEGGSAREPLPGDL